MLGTLKAGGAFLLLDPAYPPARLTEILALARPAAWLQLEAAGAPPAEVAAWLDGALPAARRLALPPWTAADPFAAEPTAPPVLKAGALGPDDLAYLAFTSGSTGVPKGILGLHGPLTHFLPWMAGRFGFGRDDRFSLLSALSHDPLQRDLFTPLCLGGDGLHPRPARDDGGRRPRRLDGGASAMTVANLTPAMAQVLTEQAPATARSDRSPVTARSDRSPATARSDRPCPTCAWCSWWATCSPAAIVARLRRLAPAVTCVNLYGSTETQRAVGYHVIPPPSRGRGVPPGRRAAVLPLGRGIDDVQLLVLTPGGSEPRRRHRRARRDRTCAARTSPRGYLGDEELTARALPGSTRSPATADPETASTAPATSAATCRTARSTSPAAPTTRSRCAASASSWARSRPRSAASRRARGGRCWRARRRRRSGGWSPTWCRDGPAGIQTSVRRDLRARLQDAAGLHGAGRLRAARRAAADPQRQARPPRPRRSPSRRADFHGPETAMSYKPPETEPKRVIAAIWQEVLERERVGVDDNFFELGGNSLLLVQVHGRLQQALRPRDPGGRPVQQPHRARPWRATSPAARASPLPTAPAEDRSEKLQQGKNRLRRRLEQRQRA